VLLTAAEDRLAHGPDPFGPLLAAGARDHRCTPPGVSELRTVAGQESAPSALRADAYASLLRVYADSDEWTKAIVAFSEWVDRSAQDGTGIGDRESAPDR
jgi:hypothetical protein